METQNKKESSVADIAQQIFFEATGRRASDIFFEPLDDELQVRLRIDGILHKFISLPIDLHSKIITRIKVLGGLDVAEHRLPQDGSFKMKFPGRAIDFRISIMPTRLGEKAVLRLLDRENLVLDIAKLGFDARIYELLKENLAKPHGMVLVCGPTGCGKTSTLYASVKYVDVIEKNIITVEDPVEYCLYGINQVAVNEAYGLTFPLVLRSVLRQDPNIILVGEIRDSDTAEIAIRAALTGHLVLSSLHTTTSTGSIARLINMGIEPFLIGSSFLLVISQSLARLLCSECKQPKDLSAGVFSELKEAGIADGIMPSVIYSAKGCSKCGNTGYHGRVAVAEALVFSPKIKELVCASASEREIRQAAQSEGMRTLRQNAYELLIKGLTSLEEIVRITSGEEIL